MSLLSVMLMDCDDSATSGEIDIIQLEGVIHSNKKVAEGKLQPSPPYSECEHYF